MCQDRLASRERQVAVGAIVAITVPVVVCLPVFDGVDGFPTYEKAAPPPDDATTSDDERTQWAVDDVRVKLDTRHGTMRLRDDVQHESRVCRAAFGAPWHRTRVDARQVRALVLVEIVLAREASSAFVAFKVLLVEVVLAQLAEGFKRLRRCEFIAILNIMRHNPRTRLQDGHHGCSFSTWSLMPAPRP